MAERVVLHVGAMKSGTSFIQATLDQNRDVLAEQGVLVPGRPQEQVQGVVDILEQKREGAKPEGTIGAWQSLLDRMAEWPGTAAISMEYLGPSRPAQIDRVLESLAPARVEIVLTVRDLARNIPAMWQETVQNGKAHSWNDYVDAIAREDVSEKGPARSFWRVQGTPRIARRWSEAVGKEHVTVVTVPPAGAPPELLWQRFCSVVGIDTAATSLAARTNPSLGGASALVMRALNERLLDGGGLSNADYNRFVKKRLAKRGLTERRASEPAIGYDATWVRRRSKQIIDELGGIGVRVVGDLAELEPAQSQGSDPNQISDREQLEAALDGLAHLIRLWSRS